MTTRQLESLIRLAEARARLDLSLVVTVEHAEDVIAVVQESLLATLEDDRGVVDFTREPGGMSKSNIKKRFVAYLHRVASTFETAFFFFCAKLYGTECVLCQNEKRRRCFRLQSWSRSRATCPSQLTARSTSSLRASTSKAICSRSAIGSMN